MFWQIAAESRFLVQSFVVSPALPRDGAGFLIGILLGIYRLGLLPAVMSVFREPRCFGHRASCADPAARVGAAVHPVFDA